MRLFPALTLGSPAVRDRLRTCRAIFSRALRRLDYRRLECFGAPYSRDVAMHVSTLDLPQPGIFSQPVKRTLLPLLPGIYPLCKLFTIPSRANNRARRGPRGARGSGFQKSPDYFGAMRIAPSRRMVSPLSILFSMMCWTRAANSGGRPSRLGNGTCCASEACAASGSPASSGV